MQDALLSQIIKFVMGHLTIVKKIVIWEDSYLASSHLLFGGGSSTGDHLQQFSSWEHWKGIWQCQVQTLQSKPSRAPKIGLVISQVLHLCRIVFITSAL